MTSELRRSSKRPREQLIFSDNYGVLDNLREYDFDLVSFYVTFTQFIDRNLYEGKPENSLVFKNNESLYKGFNISKNKFYRLLKIAYECGLIDIEKGKDNRNIYILNDHIPQETLKKIRFWGHNEEREKNVTSSPEQENISEDFQLDQNNLTGRTKLTQPVGPNRSDRLDQIDPTGWTKKGQPSKSVFPDNINALEGVKNAPNISNVLIDLNINNKLYSQSVCQSINNNINNNNINNNINNNKEKGTDGQTDFKTQELDNFLEIVDRCELEHIDARYKDAVEKSLRSLYFTEGRLRIGDDLIPKKMVIESMKKLDNMIIQHALQKFKDASEEKRIKNTVAYLKTCIYNSISEINLDVDAELRHKGII